MLTLAVGSLPLITVAKDIYVSQNGSGSTNSLAWLNSSANWGTGSSQVSPGDTVHFVGTLTSTFSVFGSGTPGNPITLYFEPGASFSAPTLPSGSYWINLNGCSYVVIDGGKNGVIQFTDNGTVVANGGTHTYGNSGSGAIAGNSGIHHVTIQNLTISNMYDRQVISEPIQGQGDGAGIWFSGSDVTVSNCFITGCQDGISCVYYPAPSINSNFTVTATTVSNYNHAITLGSGGLATPIFLNFTVTNNFLMSGDMFESPNGVELGLHRNGVFIFNESPGRDGYVSNIVIACNLIKHGFMPQSSTAGTAATFFDLYNNQMAFHVREYNNISLLAPPLAWSGGGGAISASGTDVLVANNTVIGWQSNGVWGGSEISVNGTNAFLLNNICISRAGADLGTYANVSGVPVSNLTRSNLLSGVWLDYNIYNHQTANSFVEVVFVWQNGGVWDEGIVDSFAQWTNIYSGTLYPHIDPHSTTALVNLDSNFVPLVTDTVARGHGTNLSAFFTTDYYGNPRPATGPWTIGAFEAGPGGSGNSLAVSPPTQNCGTVSVGSSNTVTFTVRNTGSAAVTGSASVGAPFIILSGSPYNLPVGQTQTVSVAYSPTIAGTNTQTVNFSGGAAVLATATVSGIAISTNSSSTNLPSTGTVMPASSGNFSAPFVLTNGYIYQPVATTVTNGGVATYSFSCSNAGNYVIQALVNAPSDANNSFYLNIDAMPQDPTMIWDMPITSGFQKQLVSWRGNGTDTNNQFVPMIFSLTQGQHQVIIVGRESNVELQNLAVLPLPLPPQNLRILAVGP